MKKPYRCLVCKKKLNKTINRPTFPLVYQCKCGQIFTAVMLSCAIIDDDWNDDNIKTREFDECLL